MRSAGTMDGAVDDAAIVVTELLTNAIRHASPLSGWWLQVTWDLEDESVEIAVSDGGSYTAAGQPSSAVTLGGRGLRSSKPCPSDGRPLHGPAPRSGPSCAPCLRQRPSH
jgi:hypothetical protein